MQMNKKIFIRAISLDITRKCNMNCPHCFRGEPEDENMSTKIIDKTLDEISDYYIGMIHLSGGEPCLCEDKILYLANQIVDRKMKVIGLGMITNGTIKSEKIKMALSILAEYFDKIKKDSWYNEATKKLLDNEKEFKNINIEVSTTWHEKVQIDEVIKFYQLPYQNCWIRPKDERGNMLIVGRMEQGYKKFPSKFLEGALLKKRGNKYNLIDDTNFPIIKIYKTISVSTNGLVYVGISQSWKDIESVSLGNILNLKGGLYERIDEYSWNHPIIENTYKLQILYDTFEWQKQNGIDKSIFDNESKKIIEKYMPLIDLYEKSLKMFHKEYSYLNHNEINTLTIAIMVAAIWEQKNYDFLDVHFLLTECGELSDEQANQCNIFYMKSIIADLINKNNIRKRQK